MRVHRYVQAFKLHEIFHHFWSPVHVKLFVIKLMYGDENGGPIKRFFITNKIATFYDRVEQQPKQFYFKQFS